MLEIVRRIEVGLGYQEVGVVMVETVLNFSES
jgi:hypothetical protein